MDTCHMLTPYLSRWMLMPDGAAFETAHSWLLPVRYDGQAAILKLRKPTSDEVYTAAMLKFYGGYGAVRVLESDGNATLMERADCARSLMEMAAGGEDEAAADILAATAQQLHAPRLEPRPAGLETLDLHFKPLFARQAERVELRAAAAAAQALLDEPRDQVVLHGDLHHNNVVFDDARGWLAIDPKGLLGERTYDVANLLCNPRDQASIALNTDRASLMAALYADRLGLEPQRVLQFALAHAGLSAAWSLMDGDDPHWSFACARIFQAVV